jgi:hypothetical protein
MTASYALGNETPPTNGNADGSEVDLSPKYSTPCTFMAWTETFFFLFCCLWVKNYKYNNDAKLYRAETPGTKKMYLANDFKNETPRDM